LYCIYKNISVSRFNGPRDIRDTLVKGTEVVGGACAGPAWASGLTWTRSSAGFPATGSSTFQRAVGTSRRVIAVGWVTSAFVPFSCAFVPAVPRIGACYSYAVSAAPSASPYSSGESTLAPFWCNFGVFFMGFLHAFILRCRFGLPCLVSGVSDCCPFSPLALVALSTAGGYFGFCCPGYFIASFLCLGLTLRAFLGRRLPVRSFPVPRPFSFSLFFFGVFTGASFFGTLFSPATDQERFFPSFFSQHVTPWVGGSLSQAIPGGSSPLPTLHFGWRGVSADTVQWGYLWPPVCIRSSISFLLRASSGSYCLGCVL